MSGQIDSELLQSLHGDPDRPVQLIATLDDDPRRYESQLQAFDLDIKRIFTLTRKVALRGTARSFIVLGRESWVTKLEEDRLVSSM
jgi:hypothetical protein